MMQNIPFPLLLFALFIILCVAIVYILSLYKSLKNQHYIWFIALLLIGPLFGILPLIYILKYED